MSSRSNKSSKATPSSPIAASKLSPVAMAAVQAAQPAVPAIEPSSEEYQHELALALAAQGGAKVNHLWDDLNVMHDETIEKIQSVGQEVAGQMVAFTQDPTRRTQIEPWQNQRLAKLITQFDIDTRLHFQDLDTIQAVHKDHTGGIVSPDDFMQVISLQGDYAERAELHHLLTMPQVTEMLEITGAVELNPPSSTTAAANDSNQDAAQA